MASEEEIQNQLVEISQETSKIDKDIQNYLRKRMTPVWNKRRDIVKQIPNFWTHVFVNAPMIEFEGENDLEALANLTDFHVEYDEKNPDYRKIVATFNKNDIFKNETLTKEYTFSDEGEGEVISKATIEYHPSKEPKKNKRKHDDDDFSMSFVDWFTNDDLMLGRVFSDDIFINALEYFNEGEDDEDDEEGKEYSLGESDEDDEEDENPKKKSRN